MQIPITNKALTIVLISLFTASCLGRTSKLLMQQKTPHPPSNKITTVDHYSVFKILIKHWEKHQDLISLTNVLSSYEIIQSDAPPLTLSLITKLTKAYYFHGVQLMNTGNTSEALLSFQRGVKTGEKGITMVSPELRMRLESGEKLEESINLFDKSSTPILYWYITNLHKFSTLTGLNASLFYHTRIFKVMQFIRDTSPRYFYGSPHRYFGVFFSIITPGVTNKTSLQKSKVEFEKALAIEPNNFSTRVAYAEHYAVKAKKKELFTELLESVINGDPTQIPELEPQQRVEQRKAQKLLDNASNLFSLYDVFHPG